MVRIENETGDILYDIVFNKPIEQAEIPGYKIIIETDRDKYCEPRIVQNVIEVVERL